jgi:hypothetical protein
VRCVAQSIGQTGAEFHAMLRSMDHVGRSLMCSPQIFDSHDPRTNLGLFLGLACAGPLDCLHTDTVPRVEVTLSGETRCAAVEGVFLPCGALALRLK